MAHFTVRFLKNVIGDGGNPAKSASASSTSMHVMQPRRLYWLNNNSASFERLETGRCTPIASTCSRPISPRDAAARSHRRQLHWDKPQRPYDPEDPRPKTDRQDPERPGSSFGGCRAPSPFA